LWAVPWKYPSLLDEGTVSKGEKASVALVTPIPINQSSKNPGDTKKIEKSGYRTLILVGVQNRALTNYTKL